jgi:hypothetical protein
MQKILRYLEQQPIQRLQLWVVLIATLIAAQIQYIQHGWINPDSVLYLEAAKFFSNGEWKAGFEVFQWPLYALSIALVNKVTQLGVHLSAQILNVIYFAIATFGFIRIIVIAGGSQRQIIAGALIWLSAQYMIGGVLEMLMRDEGFWAFYLLSLGFFIRFYQHHQTKDAILWQVSIILATLFRIEAILFLIFLPITLLFQVSSNTPEKWKKLLIANLINIGLTLVIVVMLAFSDSLSTQLLGRLNEIFTSSFWQEFTERLTKNANIMSTQVLGEYLEEFAIQGLLMTFVYVMIVKTIGSTGLINIILCMFSLKHHQQLINPAASLVLRTTAVIAIINMFLIITKMFVLSGRYVLALSLILMLFAAFYFAVLLFDNPQNKYKKWLVVVLVLFMMGGAIKNTLPKKDGYNYQQEAVAWMLANNHENKSVFYNERRMRYYANLPFDGYWDDKWRFVERIINDNSISRYDYLVISLAKNKPEHEILIKHKLKHYIELKRFYDAKHKKYVAIYKKT